MPQIEGLKEQQAALTRIKQYLKEIEDINDFLRQVTSLMGAEGVTATCSISIAFEAGSDFKRFKSPMEITDYHYILLAVQKYKESVVEKVKHDSSEYRILLSSKELESLELTIHN